MINRFILIVRRLEELPSDRSLMRKKLISFETIRSIFSIRSSETIPHRKSCLPAKRRTFGKRRPRFISFMENFLRGDLTGAARGTSRIPGRSRLRRYARSRGVSVAIRGESRWLIGESGEKRCSRITVRFEVALPFVEAVLPSDGLNRVSCRVYKSASCCSSFSPPPPVFFSCALSVSPSLIERTIDRPIRSRTVANAGDPGSSWTSVVRVNVGRTCVSADRAPLRFDRQEIRARLSSWFIADLPLRSREQPRASPARAFVKRFCEHGNLPAGEEDFLSRWIFLFWKPATSLRFCRLFCAIAVPARLDLAEAAVMRETSKTIINIPRSGGFAASFAIA